MPLHQIAMVLDLNKCLGCQTCTMACKKLWTDGDGMDYMYWNNVETRPGQGYPRNWDRIGGGFENGMLRPSELPSKLDYGQTFEYNYEERLFQGGLQAMPQEETRNTPNWDEDVGALMAGENYYFYLPRLCNHCTNPACLAACPRNAIYKREEDGIVLVDQERCEGYRYCMRACPYKKIYYNELLGKAQKCIFCYPRIEQGDTTACSKQCPGRLRFVGFLDDESSAVHSLVKVHRVALGLFPEKGTDPNVFYVPPFNPPRRGNYGKSVLEDARMPLDYLVYLFGQEVIDVIRRLELELEKAQNGGVSDVLQLLIGRDAEVRYQIPKRDQLVQIGGIGKA
ncbi:MAG: respiratory nitrate reductase subunit beta [Bryobacteraceae bacterium]|nr:respiratory nitrate reductase subunit beta [Bryobacteraceae bacterium]